MEYNGREIPESLSRLIRRQSLIKVGEYDGQLHQFKTPVLDPNDNALATIRKEYLSLKGFDESDFMNVLNYVLDNTNVTPILSSPQKLEVTGKNPMAELSHIVITEDNNAETELLYLGNQRFLVLSTSRGTILLGDILTARTMPVNVGESVDFTVTRDGEEFLPDIFVNYETYFHTRKIVSIVHRKSPELYDIIDADKRFGGLVRKKKNVEKEVSDLVSIIKKQIDTFPAELPAGEEYPDYLTLLAVAKSAGIGTYVLNLLIETYEKRDTKQYAFVEQDWLVIKSPEQLEAEEAERIAKLQKEYDDLRKLFMVELSKIRTRRVWVFFKAPGKVFDEKYLAELENRIDAFSEQGFGVKGWASQRKAEAIAESKPKPGSNLITGAIIAGVVLLAAFVAITWVRSDKGLGIFKEKMIAAESLVASGNYDEARNAYIAAYEEYRPKITSFLASGSYKKHVAALEKQIDEDVRSGIEQINLMLDANKGRYDKYTEEVLFHLLQLRPQNSELLKLKEKWMNQ